MIDIHEKKTRRLKLLGAVALIAILILSVWLVPRLQVEKEQSKKNAVLIDTITNENEYRHTMVQGFTGLALLASLWLTWKKLAALEKHAVAAQELQHDGKVTDRFYRAVQQLASDYTEVRLGGIYSLERLISDSQRDGENIREILAAYVRLRSTGDSESTALREDLRACLEVLARAFPAKKIDLARLSLAGKDLSYLNLTGFWLADARFARADLYRAILKRAMLPRADLRQAELVEAQLQGADLSGSNLERANLARAQLNGAILQGANLRGANLRDSLGLSAAQLDSCLTDETTILPTEIG